MYSRRLLLLTALVLAPTFTMAEVPTTLNYQGVLTNADGTPVTDDTYSVAFTIYDAAVAGDVKWTETRDVTTSDGLFSILLGSINPIEDTVFNATSRYLGIAVSPDPELTPRTMMVTVPYAYRVSTVDGASGGNITDKLSIGPGHTNDGEHSFVAGANNTASLYGTTVCGGDDNTADGMASSVAGGYQNRADGGYSSVGGGRANRAYGTFASVGGGFRDTAIGEYSFVGGGYTNRANFDYTFVGGGMRNTADAPNASVCGGFENNAEGEHSFVGSGYRNSASDFAAATGGAYNSASNFAAVVSGGWLNTASGEYSLAAGGINNIASDTAATVGGGHWNRASGPYSVVAGGGGAADADSNSASGAYSAILGGRGNTASDLYTSVGGGEGNSATTDHSTVSGGKNCLADGFGATVGGGIGDSANGNWSTVGGGINNRAPGRYSIIPGGRNCVAAGDHSFATGRNAYANHHGSFVWADQSSDTLFSSVGNQFNVRASGGIRMFTNSTLTSGMTISAGASSWTAVCDSTLKRNIREVDYQSVLEKVVELPISQWSYKSQDESIEHIGPMAQDFYRLFGLDEDDKHINTLDPDGVALAAIKALHQENADLKDLVQKLEQRLTDLENDS